MKEERQITRHKTSIEHRDMRYGLNEKEEKDGEKGFSGKEQEETKI